MHAFRSPSPIDRPTTADAPLAGVVTRGTGPTALEVAGVRLDPMSRDHVRGLVRSRLEQPHAQAPPLAIGSVNLDHIHHFGARTTSAGQAHRFVGGLDWYLLIDGAPVARRVRAVTGVDWPRLPGADLLPDLLTVAASCGARVGFLGGHEDTVAALRSRLSERWPTLEVAGIWTPSRRVVTDAASSRTLARSIHDARVDLLVIGLGKPRQEQWAEAHGLATGAAVLTMFGAAADFLAGSASRAPVWMRRAGCEWAFRLLKEPHRLWRRYLVQGPRALRALQTGPAVAHVRPAPGRGVDQTERTSVASSADMTSLVKR